MSRLERCIAQLSPDDSTELRALQAALEKARAQTVLPHPANQVEDCQQYCSRAKRRLEKAQEAAKIAQEAVVRFEAEFQDGLRRLEELKAAATSCGARCHGGSAHHPSRFRCGGESVASCRSGVDSRAGHPPCRHFRGRSTYPDSVGCGACGDQEPHDGHFDRGSRLRSSEKPARPFCSVLTTEGDDVQQLLLGGLRGVRVGVVSSASRAQCVEGPIRNESRRVRHVDRRCRCRSEVRKFSVQYVLTRDARYGLRGVRIGEAAHPGPPKLILRGVQVNRFDLLAREAEDEVPSTVPATPGGVDARLRDQRVFSIASSGEDADTESIPSQDFQDHRSVSEDGSQDGASIADADPEPDEVVERVEFLQFAPPGRRIREGFASLDDVDLMQLFRQRGHVMRSVPQVMKGAYTAAMRISMERKCSEASGSMTLRLKCEHGSRFCCSRGCSCSDLQEVARCRRVI